VTGFPGVSGFDLRAGAADLLQRPGEPRRIAGELNRGGIGQEFPLSAERGLDEPAEEDADRADDDQASPRASADSGPLPPREKIRMRPITARHRMPKMTPMTRRFRRMSPLRM
jgi:hypothetical protein